jgi:hypothetical protein
MPRLLLQAVAVLPAGPLTIKSIDTHQFKNHHNHDDDPDDIEYSVHGAFLSGFKVILFSTFFTPATFLARSPARSFWSSSATNPLS